MFMELDGSQPAVLTHLPNPHSMLTSFLFKHKETVSLWSIVVALMVDGFVQSPSPNCLQVIQVSSLQTKEKKPE